MSRQRKELFLSSGIQRVGYLVIITSCVFFMFCNTRATLQTLKVYHDMNQAFTNITADAMTREAVDLQQESMTQKLTIQEASPRPHQQQSQLEHQHKQKKFDCAINWIRVPKTASTSVWKAFMQPLLDSQSFSSTYLSENSCIVGPGGCADIWNTTATTGNIAMTKRMAFRLTLELVQIVQQISAAADASSMMQLPNNSVMNSTSRQR